MPELRSYTLPSACDGLPLAVCEVIPSQGAPKGLVQFAHGMAEHKERYLSFMQYLAENGWACVINDLRGHGASVRDAGDLGYFYDAGADGLIEDMHQLTLRFKQRFPGAKLALLGHSMGALAVRSYCRKYDGDIDALIVSGNPGHNPAVGAGLVLDRLLTLFKGERHISPLMASMATGSYARRFPDPNTQFAWLSVNAENVRAYDADPLCGFPFTLNGYRALLTLLKQAYDGTPAGHPELPVLFLSGADDPCAPDQKGFDDAMARMRRAGYADVTGRMIPGMRHEILNETGREAVYAELLAWLNARL